jgi:hypothetical protein
VLPVEGLAEYGAGFKTISEAVHLRNHVLGQLAVAASAGRSPCSSAAKPPSSPLWSTPPTTSATPSAPPDHSFTWSKDRRR